MFVATIQPTADGVRPILLLGLTDRNLQTLNDQPIHKRLDEEDLEGLEEWDVIVLGPDDLARFQAGMSATSIDDASEL